MAQFATAPNLGPLAGVGAHAQALAKMEMLEEAAEALVSRKKSNGLLRRGIKAWKRGDVVRAGQLSLEATNADPSNAQAFHILGMALEKMGHLHKVMGDEAATIDYYWKSLFHDPDNAHAMQELRGQGFAEEVDRIRSLTKKRILN